MFYKYMLHTTQEIKKDDKLTAKQNSRENWIYQKHHCSFYLCDLDGQ